MIVLINSYQLILR